MVSDNKPTEDFRRERLKSALEVIERYSSRHIKIDVGIGIAGILPGMGKVALIGAIALQAPFCTQTKFDVMLTRRRPPPPIADYLSTLPSVGLKRWSTT